MASRYPARGEMGYEAPEPDENEDGRKARGRGRVARKPRMKGTREKKWHVDIDGLAPSRTWYQIRETCFKRAGFRCERCGTPLASAYRADPHHRKLVARGGRDELSNLTALCPDCHRWCHDNDDAATLAGWIVPSWADPHVRAVTLWDGRMVTFDDEGGYSFEGRP